MTQQTKPIAESNSFIVLDEYTREWETDGGYQSEADLEQEFVSDLVNQGYEFVRDLTTPEAMLANVRVQLETLNNVSFSDKEWLRFGKKYHITQDRLYESDFDRQVRTLDSLKHKTALLGGDAEQKIRKYLVDNNYMDVFDSKENVDHFARSVPYEEVANDFNLSVSSYVEAKDNREVTDITKLNAEIKTTVTKIDQLRTDIDGIVAEIEGGKT